MYVLFIGVVYISQTEVMFIRYNNLDGSVIERVGLEKKTEHSTIAKAMKEGDFHSRLIKYNDALTKLRQDVLLHRANSTWRDVEQNLTVINCLKFVDCKEEIIKHSAISTLSLPWIRSNTSADAVNGALDKYYPWTANHKLCEMIRGNFSSLNWKMAFYSKLYRGVCQESINMSHEARPLEWFYYHPKKSGKKSYIDKTTGFLPLYFYTAPPSDVFTVHVFKDAVVDEYGDVITGDLKVVKESCNHRNMPALNTTLAHPPEAYKMANLYKEIFLISQEYKNAYYHTMVEHVPRLVPYLKFLKENPDILIH